MGPYPPRASTALEGGFDDLDRGLSAREERHGRGVEAHPLHAAHTREPGTPELLARSPHAGALARVDAVEGADVGTGAARPHLDDHDDGAVARDHVDLKPPD